jgi:hypothetical protein
MDKNRLEAAGVYYTSRLDIFRCAFCGVEVGWWREGDSPIANHKRFSPSCGFIKGFVVGNIPIDKPETSQEPTRSKYVCGSFMELRPNSRHEQGKKLTCILSCVWACDL